MRDRLKFPRAGHLPQTSALDWIRSYDRRGWGALLRRRLRWVVPYLPASAERILEIGFGSGVFQYELSARAGLSVAVDVHPAAAEVQRRLSEDDVRAELVRADGASLPFRTRSFDVVVMLSTIEFIGDPEACLAECRRVLKATGRLICVTPSHHSWWDVLFRSLFGGDPEAQFQGGRERARRAIAAKLPGARRRGRPAPLPRLVAPYEIVVFEG